MQRLDPSNTALLVIDIQEKLIPAMQPELWQRANRGIGILLDVAERMVLPTLVTEQYAKGLGPTISPFRESLEGMKATFCDKLSFSAFDENVAANWIKNHANSFSHFIVIGVESHICVFQTVRDLVLEGHTVVVPHDGVASRNRDDYQTALTLMRDLGAFITSSEAVAFDLIRRAEGETFKAISKRIR